MTPQLSQEDVDALRDLVNALKVSNRGFRGRDTVVQPGALFPQVQGIDWAFSKATRPLFGDIVVSQLRTTVPGSAAATLSIAPLSNQWRFVTNETFGNVTSNVFDVSILVDDLVSVGPFRATSDIISGGLTDGVTSYVGPIRKRLQYTFTNITSGSQNLEFTSFGLTVLSSLPASIMHLVGANLRALGINVQEGRFVDAVRTGTVGQ